MAKKPQPDLTSVRVVIDNATEPPATGPEDASSRRSPRRQPPALPLGCPVMPLGMMGDIRYYLDAAGQLVALRVREHTRLNILGLFGSENHLVFEYWPKTDEKGKTKGWRTEDAESQLMALAAARGLWSPMNKARGRGCWSDEAAGLIVHYGDRVLIDGRSRRPGLFGELAFVAREKLMDAAPKSEPAGPDGIGEEALSLLRCWKWRRDIDPRLLLGWIGAAFLGASLRVRPVAWIIGRRGTGKSTLQEVLAAVLSEWLLSVTDSTEAGIRQTLEHDCLPIAIDEAEEEGGNSNDDARLRSLVKLARRCYSGSQSLRGGTDHEASGFMLRSTTLFSSIRTPPLTPQDGSRMAVFKLEDQPPGAALPDLNPVRLRGIGTRILRRLIDQWPRLPATLDQYRSALIAVGHSNRTADVFGTLLALADLILSDGDVDSDSAAELAAQPDIAILPEAEDSASDEQEWLDFVLSSVLPPDGPADDRTTVAEWLRHASEPFNAMADKADRVLGNCGIKVIRAREEARVIPTALPGNGNPAISRWRTAMPDLPDCMPAPVGRRACGNRPHGIWWMLFRRKPPNTAARRPGVQQSPLRSRSARATSTTAMPAKRCRSMRSGKYWGIAPFARPGPDPNIGQNETLAAG